jgi:hypothetical protein
VHLLVKRNLTISVECWWNYTERGEPNCQEHNNSFAMSQNAQNLCITKTGPLMLFKKIFVVHCKKNNETHK